MIDIKILTHENDTVFFMDNIYSVLHCNDDMDGVVKSLVQWSNTNDEDICGVLSGGLYFVHQGQPVNEYFIEKNLRPNNIILPYEEVLSDDVINRYYSSREEYTNQGKLLIDEVSIRYPELTKGIIHAISSNFYIRANMVIGYSYDIRELYDYINCFDICINNPLMISLVIKGWVITKGIRVRSVDISDNSPEIWNCGYQKIGIVQNYVGVVLKEYIQFRKIEGFKDSFSGENPYQGDFDGKKPIWMCWWQGEEEMPELIKACIASVKRNAPANAKVVLITLDNVADYVTFTDSIIEKFNSKKISYTHLSDILRAELVFRYGGLWIDATYYISKKIDESLFEDKLFSLAFNKPLWGMDIMKGRWTLSVLGAEKGNSAIQFLMEGLWYYWDNADELVDYFLVDYIFDAGYNSFDDIRRDINSIRRCSNAVYDLQLKMNQCIGNEGLQWLQSASVFYKLNRRNEYVTKSIGNKNTFYSYIVNGNFSEKDNEIEDICIKCNSYVELVKNIRALNPKKVLDYSLFLMKEGKVSRGILADFLYDNCVIDGYISEGEIGINGKCIYDSIISVRDYYVKKIENINNNIAYGTYVVALREYADYDLVIIEKTDSNDAVIRKEKSAQWNMD